MKQLCTRFLLVLTSICIGSSGLTHAQNALSLQVQRELDRNQAKSYPLFSRSGERSEKIDRAIRDVVYLKLDRSQLKELYHTAAPLVAFDLPLAGGAVVTTTLMQYDFRTKDYRNVVRTSSGNQIVDKVDGRFYRGALNGVASSFAAFSFFEDEIGAVFSDRLNGNYNLVLNREDPGANNENYILYREADVLDGAPASCSLTDDAFSTIRKGKDLSPAAMGVFETNCNAVRVSVFADSFIYAFNSRSVVKAVQYINTVFNVISALYANDRLFLQLSETVVSTVKEGYNFSSSSTVLQRFGNLIQTYTYNGDVAQNVTGYRNSGGSSPLGGLAWLDVLCVPPTPTTIGGAATYYGPYSMANTQVMSTIPSMPTYSWDVEVCAHELGHNIGSPHTQNCGWPGGPIDNCVAPEGGCSTVGPTPVGGGTVMSYCHLKASVGINFANGFGPLPTALLKDKMATSSCLGSGVPDSTLQYASKTVIANAECFDGLWTNYFYDNNTADPSDDIYVMAINKGALDIGDITDKDFVLKMTTTSLYGKDTVAKIVVSYADSNWAEINRKWTIQLPAGKQTLLPVAVRFPYLQQDVKDIKKFAAPKLIEDTSLTFLKYATTIPVTGPGAVAVADVRKLPFSFTGSSPKIWRSGSAALYRYVEVLLDSGLYGGTLGYQRQAKSGIAEFGIEGKLTVYPNPVQQNLTVELPGKINASVIISVFDNLGRAVVHNDYISQKGSIQLDLGFLSAGVYMIQCIDPETSAKMQALFIKQ